MTKRRKNERARESAAPPEPTTPPDEALRTGAESEARASFTEETSDDRGTLGEELETRVRHREDERRRLDALDDAEVPMDRDDLPADAVDEIALSESPDEYETTDTGDRRARRDEAEMGFGGEARSADEIADQVLGREIPGRRGTTREGEAHGPYLGLE